MHTRVLRPFPGPTVRSVRDLVLGAAALLVVAGGVTTASAADLLEHGLSDWVVEGTGQFDERGEKMPVWTFADGVVRCAGRGFGFLRHRETFADFRLTLEYRFPKKGNSGIGVRTIPFTGVLETRPSRAAYEIQLLSDQGKPPERSSCCSLYGIEPPRENTSRAVGEWNTVVIECRGPRIRVDHNGVEVVDYDQSTRAETARKPLVGSICLQNHGSQIEFRGIRVDDLGTPPR